MQNGIPFKVSKSTYDLLSIGNNIIKQTKENIPYAGNIKQNIYKQGFDIFLDTIAMSRTAAYHQLQSHKRRYAYLTSRYKVGTCIGYAAFVYTQLRKEIPHDKYAAIIRLDCKPVSHEYAAILQQPNLIIEDDIIVDAWPPNAQAILFQHHISYRFSALIKIQVAKKSISSMYEPLRKHKYRKFISLPEDQYKEHVHKAEKYKKLYSANPSKFLSHPYFFSDKMTDIIRGKTYRYFY